MPETPPVLVTSKINDNWAALRGKFQKPAALRHRIKVYLTYTVPSLLRPRSAEMRKNISKMS